MNTLKKFWDKFRDVFGLRRNSKYVSNYLNDANMHSGIFMSAVIFALEVWLLIRQTDKYIIPTLTDPNNKYSFFRVVFTNTSNFWLLLSFGTAMFFYCLFYKKMKGNNKRLLPIIIASGISLIFCALMPFEFIYSSRPIEGVKLYLLIVFYASVIVFNITTIIASIYQYKGRNNQILTSVAIISLFALVCLAFGVKVSYSDFSSVKTDKATGNLVPNPDYKEIICFLMMAMYVGCLLIWRPYISMSILGVVFFGFFFLLEYTVDPEIRKFPEGDQVNYITFFISLTMICISIYNQRISEARKDEELEILATKDIRTDLWSFEYFNTLVAKKIKEESIQPNEYIYLFVNVKHFRVYNDQKGFDEGNKLLKILADYLTESFPNELITRQSDDHFIVFSKNENIQDRLKVVDLKLSKLDKDCRPGIRVGGYLFQDPNEDTHVSIEKARYAYSSLYKQGFGIFLEYDKEMHDKYRLNQYIVNHIDEAVENGYIKAYYQPVVYAKGRELCGAEALARWIDPKYGFLSPATFIPALENARLIYKLDIAMLRLICKQMRENLDKGEPVIPVSINFSRVDFRALDVVSVIDKTMDEFKIPHDLIHVEITESALMNDGDLLKNSIKRLHDLGYSVWLDDFGSGYSSFNVLKDYNFDVLKLDMEFLVGFDHNEKAKYLIKSVIPMAKQIGMKTLSEGVETKEEADFLESIGCGRLQGYLYGKPLPYEELKALIDKGTLKLSKDILNYK